MKNGKNELAQLVNSLKVKNNKGNEDKCSSCIQQNETSALWTHIKTNQFPERYRDVTFSDFEYVGTEEQKSIQKKLIWHLKNSNPVLMYGNNGTGKTMLAYASMRDLIEKGMSPLYVTLFNLMSEIKESFNSEVLTSRIMEKYLNCDSLFIDEIDKSYRTATEFFYFFNIINSRYSSNKPTVLISNAGESDIMDVVGISNYERIVEDGVAAHKNMESYRKRITRKKVI